MEVNCTISDDNGIYAFLYNPMPPVFGDGNDAFIQHGEESTRRALAEAATPLAASPFDVMSEEEFSAMSVSEKAERVAEHYRSALAVDASGEILSRYRSGVWKVISGKPFDRDVAKLFQRLRAPFSAGKISGVVDTLKLMLPQQADPARRLASVTACWTPAPAASARKVKTSGCARSARWTTLRPFRVKRLQTMRRTSGSGSTAPPDAIRPSVTSFWPRCLWCWRIATTGSCFWKSPVPAVAVKASWRKSPLCLPELTTQPPQRLKRWSRIVNARR